MSDIKNYPSARGPQTTATPADNERGMKQATVDVLEQHTSAGTWSFDMETGELWWSAGTYAVHGLPIAGHPIDIETALGFYEDESRKRIQQVIEAAATQSIGWSEFLSVRRADGAVRCVHSIGRIDVRPGKKHLLSGAVIDIHELSVERQSRMDAASDTHQGNTRWRIAAETAGLSLFEIEYAEEEPARVLIIGDLAQRVSATGQRHISILHEHFRDMIRVEDRALREQRLDAHRAGTLSFHACDYRLQLPHGSEVTLRETGHYTGDERSGRLLGSLCDISVQATAERSMRSARQRLEQTLKHAPIGMALIGVDGQWLSVNDALCDMLGYGVSEMRQLKFQHVSHPDDIQISYRYAKKLLNNEVPCCRLEKRYLHRDGSVIDAQIDVTLLRDEQGQPLYFISHIQDISQRLANERALFDAKQLADVTFEAIGEGVIRTGADARIIQINSAACSLLQCEPDDALGQVFADVVQLFDAELDQTLPDPVGYVLSQGQRIRAPMFTRLVRRDGPCISIVDSASPICGVNGLIRGAVFVFRDVTDARRMTDELDFQANHDMLTGLYNRRGFEQAISDRWVQMTTRGACHYVLCIDLDHFKAINDLSGHATGDEMLRQVATALRGVVRREDLVARLGGDEFAAIVEAPNDEVIERIADRLIGQVRELRLSLDANRHDGGASVGIARLDTASESWSQVLMQADAALYVAKEGGRSRHHIFSEAHDVQGLAQSYISATRLLQSGFDEDRFVLHLQRIVTASGAILGFEALLRYHADHGLVAPDVFLPTAKRLGLMSRLDCWVMSNALRLISDALANGLWAADWRLSINLSPVSLGDPSFAGELRTILATCPAAVSHVDIEIIESDQLSGPHYRELVDELRSRGIRIWLDDFASGYNSFDTLKRVSVDGIKIDRSFIQDVEHDPIDRALLHSIADISAALSLQVTAEGIESDKVFAILRLSEFERFQGFLFHRPGAAGSVLAGAQASRLS